jgi:ArsR family transcriptional regulator, arsenate/arsenite/antimonite-responsive transcriptional repressor
MAAIMGVRDADSLGADVVIDGLAALAHPTRLAAFRLLVRRGADGETAGELARRLDVPPQTLSFHLKELSRAGLVHGRRDGRNIFYAVDFDHARRLIAYLTDSCCSEATPVVRSRPIRKEALR